MGPPDCVKHTASAYDKFFWGKKIEPEPESDQVSKAFGKFYEM